MAPPAVQYHHSASPYEQRIGFCRALRAGDRILVSGTGPVGPDGSTVGEGDAYAQAKRCFTIVREALEALGGCLDQVVRTRMFLSRADVWEDIGRAHGECFAAARPAATMVVVKELLDPDWLVEIEAEAWSPA